MSDLRFKVGAVVLCNLGEHGWKLGRVIALHYREPQWPEEQTAPYQVILDDDNSLIYVPRDDDRLCREATAEDLKIIGRIDALAELPPGFESNADKTLGTDATLCCTGDGAEFGSASYRKGQCHGCTFCPKSWSYAELYSEHYRCVDRNGLKVSRQDVDLGTVLVGDSINLTASAALGSTEGFLQCPTLVRLPPGVHFSDDGRLAGQVNFDPHRDTTYRVEFVAVSTANWDNDAVGIVRLQISFLVEGNEAPDEFDIDAFDKKQQKARSSAGQAIENVWHTWERWERGELGNRATCDQICTMLSDLRSLLEQHPRLDNGLWWSQLGGFYMNVHKLLENTLFECELYLGYALTFGDAAVRQMAERNLEGCYQKRLLEAARFMWSDGAQQMIRGEWAKAAETMQAAASKKDGWGWAVNYGDIWIGEAAARLVHGAELIALGGSDAEKGTLLISQATRLLNKGVARANESKAFSTGGHPWASEISAALTTYKEFYERGSDTSDWLEAFKSRTLYWCAQVLAGTSPFPPKLRPRLEDAAALIQQLPGHND